MHGINLGENVNVILIPKTSDGPYTIAGRRIMSALPKISVSSCSAFSLCFAIPVHGFCFPSSVLGFLSASYTWAVENSTNTGHACFLASLARVTDKL